MIYTMRSLVIDTTVMLSLMIDHMSIVYAMLSSDASTAVVSYTIYHDRLYVYLYVYTPV